MRKVTGRGSACVLLTGVCGMIGSHLLDVLLAKGYRVIGLDDVSTGKIQNISASMRHPNFKFIRLDVCDAKKLMKKVTRADVILHMAASKKIGESNPVWDTLHGNAAGAESVMTLARRRGAKVVFGSTSDVYGFSDRIPFREDGASIIGASTAKRWSYAVAKLYGEHIVLGLGKDWKVPVVVLRYFGCFSERSSSTWTGGHIPMFIDAIANDRQVVIHGDGRQTRSMGHVDDIVRGTLLAMNARKAVGEIINLGNDEEVSVLKSAKMIHSMMGVKRPLKLKFVPLKKVFGSYQEIPRRIPDLRKAKMILGYSPRITFEESLRRTITAHQKNERS